jgi:hypothetical protein
LPRQTHQDEVGLADRDELEQLERELQLLNEAEQASLQRAVCLPLGHAKSQALAEHWNAEAGAEVLRRRRQELLERIR